MIELTPTGRGQIVSHNLYPRDDPHELRARVSVSGSAGERAESIPAGRSLEQPPTGASEIAELRSELADLRRRVQELEGKLDAGQG